MKKKISRDKDNRLATKSKKIKKSLSQEGRFSVDKKNNLIYYFNQPKFRLKQYGLSKQIRFVGRWKLNQNHDLEYWISKTRILSVYERLTFRGKIAPAQKDKLTFKIKATKRPPFNLTKSLELKGCWHSDKYNRLCFSVFRREQSDEIVLRNKWMVNKNQQITYCYRKEYLKTKTKQINTLLFRGHWKISERNRLAYILENSKKNSFNFRAQLETPNLYPKKGAIKYRLGIGVGKDADKQLLSIFGEWKFGKRFNPYFVVNYGKAGIDFINFRANTRLGRNNQIILSLIDKRGRPLGMELKISRRFLNKLKAELSLGCKDIFDTGLGVNMGIKIPF